MRTLAIDDDIADSDFYLALGLKEIRKKAGPIHRVLASLDSLSCGELF